MHDLSLTFILRLQFPRTAAFYCFCHLTPFPVDTRRRFNVYKTSIRRRVDVLQTLKRRRMSTGLLPVFLQEQLPVFTN